MATARARRAVVETAGANYRRRLRSLLTDPGLGPAQQRETHETTDFEFRAAFDRLHLQRVDLAAGRVEDLAAFPGLAVLLCADWKHVGSGKRWALRVDSGGGR